MHCHALVSWLVTFQVNEWPRLFNSIAAFFHAAIFEDKPEAIDFTIHNDPERYGPDLHHDRDEVIPTASERAKVLHETI
ncbi:MAG: hypothetical protein R6U98_22410 [Pirellulaceae bacterium]